MDRLLGRNFAFVRLCTKGRGGGRKREREREREGEKARTGNTEVVLDAVRR
jgi:hypothetical protein